MNDLFEKTKIDIQLNWRIFSSLILKSNFFYLNVILFVIVVMLLQWLFSADQLGIIFDPQFQLSVADKIDIFVNAFLDIFKFIDDVTPVSFVLIGLFQSVSITLLIKIYYDHKKRVETSKVAGSLGISLLGAGCVACGGSLLTPILGFFAVNISISFAQRISDALLVIAVILSYIALSRISVIAAAENLKKNEKSKTK